MFFKNLSISLNNLLAAATDDIVLWTPRVLLAFVVMLVFLWLAHWVELGVGRLFKGRGLAKSSRRFFMSVARVSTLLVGASFALSVLGLGRLATGLIASGSVVAIVLGFAFQQIGTNFIAGIFMVFSRPFNQGDIIEVNGFQGIVKEIDLRVTHIRNPNGRDIYIPNATIYTNPVINYTLDHLSRQYFTVRLAHKDNTLTVIKLLADTIRKVPGVLPEPTAGGGINNELGVSGVTVQMYYWLSMKDDHARRTDITADVMNRCRAMLVDSGYIATPN